jgi:hypothetical protein
VRTATGRGFTPGGANGGRQGSVASARAREKQPGGFLRALEVG